MIPNQCSFCRGKLVHSKTECIARAGNEVVVMKDVPAFVCEQCKEAYFDREISRKIDDSMRDARQGKLSVRPLAAGDVA